MLLLLTVEERGIGNILLSSCGLSYSVANFYPSLDRCLASRDVPLLCKEEKDRLFFYFFLYYYDHSVLTTTLPVSTPTQNDITLKDLQSSQLHHVLAAQQEIWQYNLGEVKDGI